MVDGIPLLVGDRGRLDSYLAEARASGRRDWYEAVQSNQLEGPYRHALNKRKAYVQSVLAAHCAMLARSPVGLDLGCGDGQNLVWLSPYFRALSGSDYNLARLRRAKQVAGVAGLFVADVTDYPVVDETFDVIFFNHVLEHIRDDAKALAEVFRIVRPGGLVILGVPNEGAFFWQLAYRLEPQSLRTTDHVQFYTAAMLSEKCKAAGFEVQDVKPIGWGVPHWTLDTMIRQLKWVDDLLTFVGARLLQSQATSLYLLLRKPPR